MKATMLTLIMTIGLSTSTFAKQAISEATSQISDATTLMSVVFSEEFSAYTLGTSSEASDLTSSVNIVKRKKQRSFAYNLAIVDGDIARYDMDQEHELNSNSVKTLQFIEQLRKNESNTVRKNYVKLFGEKRLQAITKELSNLNTISKIDDLDTASKVEILKDYIHAESTEKNDIVE